MNGVSIDVNGEPIMVAGSNLVGSAVQNHNGEDLGEVKEVMLGTYSGQVSYVVLSFGGFLGMGKKLFAVPWSALTFNSTKGLVVLHVEKDRLKHAVGFDKDRWPSAVDPSWWEETQFYFRANP